MLRGLWEKLGWRLTPSGRWTRRSGTLRADGAKSRIRQPLNQQGGVDYTLEELATMTTLCAWCGKPIFIGEPLILGWPLDQNVQPKGQTWPSDKGRPFFVGCLRWECAETAACIGGYWVPDPDHPGLGMVMRVMSPVEQLFANPKATMVIMDDVNNPNSIRVFE